jgi:hypothetical protein
MHRKKATYTVGLLEPRATVIRCSYKVKKDHLTVIPHAFVHDLAIATKQLTGFS